MSRSLRSLRLDNSVQDWFTLNGANLNGTLDKVARCLVQRCQIDRDFANRIIRNGKHFYYKIDIV